MTLPEELKARGYGEHSSSPLDEILSGKRGIYHGVDPTADSLHVGHLVPLILMRRLAEAGHRTVFLVGGGTGMIGDPRESGERTLLDKRTLEHNKRGIRSQLQKIVGRNIELVDNASWLSKTSLLEFLRDIGKHFTVNELIKRDLIRRRLDDPNDSISFTEFSYALLQGFDFLTLFKKKGIDTQVGGADQWTNMLSGVDLIRKKLGETAYCFTSPLVTDAAGKKFGKSEGNAVWLDAKKTSPFEFYQFWLALPDTGLETYLKLYTFMPLSEITALMETHAKAPQERAAQLGLARAVTELVHGAKATEAAAAASAALFGGKALSELTKDERAVLLTEAPTIKITKANPGTVTDALVAGALASSKSDARRLIEAKGVLLNSTPVDSVERALTEADFSDGLALLKKGKRDVRVLILK